jgi:hypothetical protein
MPYSNTSRRRPDQTRAPADPNPPRPPALCHPEPDRQYLAIGGEGSAFPLLHPVLLALHRGYLVRFAVAAPAPRRAIRSSQFRGRTFSLPAAGRVRQLSAQKVVLPQCSASGVAACGDFPFPSASLLPYLAASLFPFLPASFPARPGFAAGISRLTVSYCCVIVFRCYREGLLSTPSGNLPSLRPAFKLRQPPLE